MMSVISGMSFKSEFSIQVYMIPNRHFIPDRVFNLNEKWNELDPEWVETQSEFM